MVEGSSVIVRSDNDAGGEAPYFFLAYAHTSEQKWVGRLYRDLCTEIYERTTLPIHAQVGFMDDTAIPLGGDWRENVAQALARCRIFVPLYSRRYFTREECGKEWYAFARRILDHKARTLGNPTAIVPALWTPVDADGLPDVARNIQFNHATLGTVYAAEGFYTLIKNTYYEQAYTTAVQELAKHIIRAAEQSQLRPCDPRDLSNPRNAFDRGTAEIPADRRLTITVAAPTKYEVPAGRSPAHYGERPQDWNPYHPATLQALAEYAGSLARLDAYTPEITSLDEGFDTLMDSDPAAGLGVLLVDAWAAGDPATARRLQRFDHLDKPWVGTMVPFSRDDPETAANAQRLRQSLRSVLGRRLDDVRIGASVSVAGIPTLEEFRRLFPSVLQAALYRYLNNAPARPPEGDASPQPHLSGPPSYMPPRDRGTPPPGEPP
jgi:FxsC-like protein